MWNNLPVAHQQSLPGASRFHVRGFTAFITRFVAARDNDGAKSTSFPFPSSVMIVALTEAPYLSPWRSINGRSSWVVLVTQPMGWQLANHAVQGIACPWNSLTLISIASHHFSGLPARLLVLQSDHLILLPTLLWCRRRRSFGGMTTLFICSILFVSQLLQAMIGVFVCTSLLNCTCGLTRVNTPGFFLAHRTCGVSWRKNVPVCRMFSIRPRVTSRIARLCDILQRTVGW